MGFVWIKWAFTFCPFLGVGPSPSLVITYIRPEEVFVAFGHFSFMSAACFSASSFCFFALWDLDELVSLGKSPLVWNSILEGKKL